MTAKTFKQKAPTVEAIEVTSVIGQSAEVANLIGSQAFHVDAAVKEATFILDDATKLVVKEGQVVQFMSGVATASDASAFYALYEQV